MIKVVIAMTIAAAAAAVGQIFVRLGMQQVGALEQYAPLALVQYFTRALLNPNVIVGTLLNGVFYALFLAALSWTDVTVVLPMTALEFGMAAILAVMLLNESVPTLRWTGILLVILGVVFIAMGGGEHA
jgi:undecaprenyl phosphate-alpha-L-ara4N flippase subunit ArnE